MTTGYLGYVTAFDGITLSSSNVKPVTAIGSTNTVQEKMFTLPNGTKINYDGSTDTNVTPGRIKVDFILKNESSNNLYDGLQAKKGNRGTLTKTKFSTGSPGTETCTAVLMNIEVNQEKSRPQKGKVYITAEFELETDWA